MSNNLICTRCIYDSSIPNIEFNEKGVCNYCLQVDAMEEQFGTGTDKGKKLLSEILEKIKGKGNKKYDCIIGVSGGTDSSYLLIKAKEWGLKPLAVHYDNTWNSAIATENIKKVTSKLNIDLYTYVIDNKESEDIYRSFLLAGVPEFEASTDIAFAQVLRMVAAKYRVKYILEGHSFKAEGISPIGKNYFDGKYIKDIHKKYGKYPLRTYPNMTFWQFMKWIFIYRQQFIRPLWYLDYSKEKARELLIEKTGWKYYDGHHLENRGSAYLHSIYNPKKFNIDQRYLSLSGSVRSGIISKTKALEIYNTPLEENQELENYVKKRLALNDKEYNDIINGPKRNFRDFKTYKKRFERMRPIFYILAKANLVPMSFYLKYCFPIK